MRYFYVTYQYKNGFGSYPCSCASYISLTDMQKLAYEQIRKELRPDTHKLVLISNIIELNEQDYNDFVK